MKAEYIRGYGLKMDEKPENYDALKKLNNEGIKNLFLYYESYYWDSAGEVSIVDVPTGVVIYIRSFYDDNYGHHKYYSMEEIRKVYKKILAAAKRYMEQNDGDFELFEIVGEIK